MKSPAELRADAAELLARAKELDALPEDDFEEGNIIAFTKTFDTGFSDCRDRVFNYAAIKAAGRWFLTGQERGSFQWLDLLKFVGFDNLDSITYVTAERPLV